MLHRKLKNQQRHHKIRPMDEALTVAQRLKRSRVMKAKAGIIARKRKIALNKKASPEKLKQRALKKAKGIVRAKITGGKSPNELSFSDRERVEKVLKRKSSRIKTIAKTLLPVVKANEKQRLKTRREKK